MKQALCISLVGLASLGTQALADGGPENVILLVDATSAESLYLANHYIAARGVPHANVLYFDPSPANHASFKQVQLPGFLGSLEQAGIAGHIDYVLVLSTDAFFVPVSSVIVDSCSPVNRLSLASVYTLAFRTDEVLAGLIVQTTNTYASGADTVPAFDSSVAWLNGSPSTLTTARRYFIGAQLGYTGANGNTIGEVIELIDRSAAADGTRPAGTWYFMNNAADPARNVRAPQFPLAVSAIQSLGGMAMTINGVIPTGKHDCLGILTGAATPDIAGGDFTLVDGAYADHLTSFAATFSTSSQRKVSDWIRKGASASHGAVEEPCNYTSKFPSAKILHYYQQGATMGEAWFRSHFFIPIQTVLYGDPMTRAHTYIPSAEVTNPPTSPLSGTVPLTVVGSTTRPGAAVDFIDVMIDGVVVATVANGATYMLDTAALNDGWHELRVVARDNSQSLSSGSSAIPITVNNAGLSCSIAPSATGGNLASVFQFTIAGGAAGVIESRVVHNSRVIASIPSGSGVVEVPAQMIGAGEATLFAECELADGSVFRSPPVSLDIAFTGAPTPGQTPIAFNSAKRVTNAHPFVVELPAAFLDALPGANYSVLSSPYQCTTIQAGAGPFAIYEPVQAAHGVDTMTFRVATASGESSVATVRIIYTNCAADMDASGTLDFFDFLTFQNLFSAQVPSADFDRDGQFTFFDFLGFQNSFAGGC